MWRRGEDGSWLANVTWSRAPGENRIDTFPAENVRPWTGTQQVLGHRDNSPDNLGHNAP